VIIQCGICHFLIPELPDDCPVIEARSAPPPDEVDIEQGQLVSMNIG
jgi:hypothetical protein